MSFDEGGNWIEDEEEVVKPALWAKPQVAKHQVGKHQPIVGKHKSCNPEWSVEKAKLYGKMGGKARLKNDPQRRREIAQKAAQALWKKKRAEQC